MSRDHEAEITWSSTLVDQGLPTSQRTIQPTWFWDDLPKTTEGWSLVCEFDAPPQRQGNPSRARVHFMMDSAPHDRLGEGVSLRMFEPSSRQYATVRILD